jgi:hypothetical protein
MLHGSKNAIDEQTDPRQERVDGWRDQELARLFVESDFRRRTWRRF